MSTYRVIARRSGSARLLRTGLAAVAVVLATGPVGSTSWSQLAHAAPLAAALLTTQDLPPGWTLAGELDNDAELAFSCPTLPAAPQPLAQVGVLLVAASADEMAYQSVARYRVGEAAQVLAAARADAAPYGWQQPLDDGAAASLMLLPPRSMRLADEAAVRRLVMQAAGVVVTGELVLIRRGDRVTQLTHLQVGRAAGAQDEAVTQLLAQAAERRLGLADD